MFCLRKWEQEIFMTQTPNYTNRKHLHFTKNSKKGCIWWDRYMFSLCIKQRNRSIEEVIKVIEMLQKEDVKNSTKKRGVRRKKKSKRKRKCCEKMDRIEYERMHMRRRSETIQEWMDGRRILTSGGDLAGSMEEESEKELRGVEEEKRQGEGEKVRHRWLAPSLCFM